MLSENLYILMAAQTVRREEGSWMGTWTEEWGLGRGAWRKREAIEQGAGTLTWLIN